MMCACVKQMPDGWEVLRVLESLHSRVHVLESSMPKGKKGGWEDKYVPPPELARDLKIMRFRSPELYKMYVAFRTNKIGGTGHDGMWFINEHVSFNTLFGEGESKSNSMSFCILDTENVSEEDELSLGFDKSKLTAAEDDDDDITLSMRNVSLKRYKLSLYSYDGGIERLQSTFQGSLRDIVNNLNTIFP